MPTLVQVCSGVLHSLTLQFHVGISSVVVILYPSSFPQIPRRTGGWGHLRPGCALLAEEVGMLELKPHLLIPSPGLIPELSSVQVGEAVREDGRWWEKVGGSRGKGGTGEKMGMVGGGAGRWGKVEGGGGSRRKWDKMREGGRRWDKMGEGKDSYVEGRNQEANLNCYQGSKYKGPGCLLGKRKEEKSLCVIFKGVVSGALSGPGVELNPVQVSHLPFTPMLWRRHHCLQFAEGEAEAQWGWD